MSVFDVFTAKIAERGWGIREAGEALDCAPSYISGLKLGSVTPSLALAARIERVLGIPCRDWAEEKLADRTKNRPAALGRQGRFPKGSTKVSRKADK